MQNQQTNKQKDGQIGKTLNEAFFMPEPYIRNTMLPEPKIIHGIHARTLMDGYVHARTVNELDFATPKP